MSRDIDKPKAIVLVSGGLDSYTTLAIAKDQGFACYGLTIDYGQRHHAELTAARRVADSLAVVDYKVITMNMQAIGGSALTDPALAVPETPTTGIPITYVPARNTIMLSIALGWAEVLGASDIFIGVNAVDYSGYPDCRPEFIQAFAHMAQLATKAGVEGHPLHIHVPLIAMSKSQIIQTGSRLGLDYGITISCYQATDDGLACGVCDACRLRREGFLAANLADPTRYC